MTVKSAYIMACKTDVREGSYSKKELTEISYIYGLLIKVIPKVKLLVWRVVQLGIHIANL